jgi:hypothetical protein
MVSKKQKERAEPKASRARLDAAIADFTRPTLEEMLKAGDELFKHPRSRNKVQRKRTGVRRLRARAGSETTAKRGAIAAALDADDAHKSQRRQPSAHAGAVRAGRAAAKGGSHAKLRVGMMRQDDPGDEHSSNQTLAVLLSNIRPRRPRRDDDPGWVFVLGGKRDYVGILTQGPNHFSGQYPVWRGRTFEGCMSFDLLWADVRRILESVYGGLPVAACFAGHVGSFVP